MNPDCDTLIHQYLDGRLTPAETSELVQLLAENPAAAERFAELTRVDESLRVELKAAARSEVFAWQFRAAAKPAQPATDPRKRRRWLAAAAGLAALGSGAWWFSDPGRPEALVNAWAKTLPRVKVKTEDAREMSMASRPPSAELSAAELRRKLRGFALPLLHIRAANINDTLASLNRQWRELPHADPGAAERIKIGMSPKAQALWATRSDEPGVTLDIPGISLYTALDLIAAQAGLRVAVDADAVTLEPDPRDGDTEEKTWTFPLAQATSDKFLAAIKTPAPAPVMLGVPVTMTSRFVNAAGAEGAGALATEFPALSAAYEAGVADGKALAAAGGDVGDAIALLRNRAEAGQPGEQFLSFSSRLALADSTIATAPVDEPALAGVEILSETSGESPSSAFGVTDVTTESAVSGERLITRSEEAAGTENSEEGLHDSVGEVRLTAVDGGDGSTIIGVGAGDSPSPATEMDLGQRVRLGLTMADTSFDWNFIPPPAPTVSHWMGAFGLTATAVNHDTETGVLSVTGTHRALRTAATAVAALTESAHAGASVELRVVELGDLPLPEELRTRSTSVFMEAGRVEELCRKAASREGSACRRFPIVTSSLEKGVEFSLQKGEVTTMAHVRTTSEDRVFRTVLGHATNAPEMDFKASIHTLGKSGESWTYQSDMEDGTYFTHTDFSSAEGSWTASRPGPAGRVLLIRVKFASQTP